MKSYQSLLVSIVSIVSVILSDINVDVARNLMESDSIAVAPSSESQNSTVLSNGECLNWSQNAASNQYTFDLRGIQGGSSGRQILPLQPWEEIHPQVHSNLDTIVSRIWYGSPAIRSFDGHEEVWFTGISRGREGSDFLLEPFVAVFRSNVGDWRTYSGYLADTQVWIQQIYSAPDGSIWGIPGRSGLQEPDNFGRVNGTIEIPLLAKFDDISQQFVPALGINYFGGASADQEDTTIGIAATHNSIRTIVIDPYNAVWLFTTPGGVYRYDPQQETTEHILDLIGITRVAVSPAGDFVFQARRTQASQLELFLFSPLNNQITELSYPSAIGRFFGYAYDSQGRLWLGGRGYRDTNGEWHLVAISWEQSGVYGPTLDFVSSDGRLWFSYSDEGYPNGRAWYDPNVNMSCTFSNYSFDLGGYAEDPHGFLWLTYGSKIYRLSLSR